MIRHRFGEWFFLQEAWGLEPSWARSEELPFGQFFPELDGRMDATSSLWISQHLRSSQMRRGSQGVAGLRLITSLNWRLSPPFCLYPSEWITCFAAYVTSMPCKHIDTFRQWMKRFQGRLRVLLLSTQLTSIQTGVQRWPPVLCNCRPRCCKAQPWCCDHAGCDRSLSRDWDAGTIPHLVGGLEHLLFFHI